MGGSSPHVRGTQKANSIHICDVRFIPACAGNTSASTGYTFSFTVHPRMCGEHTRQPGILSKEYGSSPHVRGTH